MRDFDNDAERQAYEAALDVIESEVRVGPDDWPMIFRGWFAGRDYERTVAAARLQGAELEIERLRGALAPFAAKAGAGWDRAESRSRTICVDQQDILRAWEIVNDVEPLAALAPADGGAEHA